MYFISGVLIAVIMTYPLILLNEYNRNSRIALSKESRRIILIIGYILFFALSINGESFVVLFGYFVYVIPIVILLSIVSIRNSNTPFVMVDDTHVLAIKNKRFLLYLALIITLLVSYFGISTINNDDVLTSHKEMMQELSRADNYIELIVDLSENPSTLIGVNEYLDQILEGTSNVVYGTTFIKHIETVIDNGQNSHSFRFEYQRVNDEWKLVRLASESWTVN